MRTILRFMALFVLAAMSFACQSAKDQSVTRLDSLDQYLQTVFPENEPGGAVLIMKEERVLFSRGYGVADVETGERISPLTLFNLGSVSKTFVANAILKLADEKKLSVEDPLSKYFEFENKSIGDRVKIKHLLTHTSGLPDNRRVADDTVFYLSAKDEENWAPILKASDLNFTPGSRYEYSNPAFNGLALIIEKVASMKWQAYVIDEIIRPSGMTTTTITDGPHPESGVAHAYIRVGDQWKQDDYGEEPTFAAAGNGGVWSSAVELAKYEAANRRAIFLRKELIKEARTVKQFPEWNAGHKPFIGWSWFIEEAGGVKTIGHSGDQGGFLCEYVNVPERKAFFVILCNTRRDIKAVRQRVLGHVLKNP